MLATMSQSSTFQQLSAGFFWHMLTGWDSRRPSCYKYPNVCVTLTDTKKMRSLSENVAHTKANSEFVSVTILTISKRKNDIFIQMTFLYGRTAFISNLDFF